MEPDVGERGLRYHLVLLLLASILVVPVLASETPIYAEPYSLGYEYKNGTWVDNMLSNDHNAVSGVGNYTNSSAAIWKPPVMRPGQLQHGWNESTTYQQVQFNRLWFNNSMHLYVNWSATAAGGTQPILVSFFNSKPKDTGGYNTGNRYVVLYSSSSYVIRKYVAGSATALATVAGTASAANTWYRYDVFVNMSGASWTINFSGQSMSGLLVHANDATYSSGYIGFCNGINTGYYENYKDFSVESPPGAGATWQNGVNWTNMSGYPVDGITSGATIVLNDTTTRRHSSLLVGMPHTTVRGGTSTSVVGCDPSSGVKCAYYTDTNKWNITNGTWAVEYTTENISFVTNSMVGTYNVNETVTNTYGINWTTKTNYLSINAPLVISAPVANWNATIRGGGTAVNDSGYAIINGTKTAYINFVDMSTGDAATSWRWYLTSPYLGGDINNSVEQNWNANITVPGLYSVNFSATNEGGTSWRNGSALVLIRNKNTTVIWNISANGKEGITYGNRSTKFYGVDSSSGTNLTDPDSYYWNWTDGNITTRKDGVHNFPVKETEYQYWEVSHNATEDVNTPWANISGLSIKTSIVRVFINSTPNVTLTADVTSGSTPLTVTFTTTDVGHIKTDYWCWTFGDGGISSGEQNPVHTYTSAGTYTVHIVAGNYTLGLTDFVRTNYITASTTPVAAWNATIYGIQTNISGYGLVNGTKDAKIQLVDSSINTPTSWLWTLNTSGNVPFNSSTNQNWNAVIKVPGLYSVNFSATNAAGTSWFNRSDFIVVQNKNATSIWNIGSNTSFNKSTKVYFFDVSTGTNLTGWYWAFGDGNWSTSQNGAHNYSVTGKYTVSLNATEDAGTPWQNITATVTRTAYVSIINNTPNLTFWSDVQSGATPLTVTFTEAHNQTVENYTWLFVTSAGSIEFTDRNQTPTYIFKNGGTYSVNYSVMNYENVVWFNRSAFITATAVPVADFSCDRQSGTSHYDVFCEDSSTNNPTSYSWSIENGSYSITSTVKNPIFNMTWGGLYNVNHSATNAGGTDWENKTGYLLVYDEIPDIQWNKTPSSVANKSSTVYFVDWSTGVNITGFSWNFTDSSDGSTNSYKRNTTHIFSKWPWPNEYYEYQVEHNVTQSGGTPWNSTEWQNDTFLSSIRIYHNETPTSIITPSAYSGTRHLPVTWTNERVGHIEQDYWLWQLDLPDGTNTSTDEHPLFIYERAGLYTATVHSGNYTLGNGSYTKYDEILVYNAQPTSSWSSNPIVPTAINLSSGFTVTDSSSGTNISGPLSAYTMWGDGNASFGFERTWYYNITTPLSSPYSINHSITDSPGTEWELTSWSNQSNVLWVVNDTVNFTLEVLPTSGQRPLAVTPTLVSDGGRIMYCNYSWGDGNVTNGSTINPLHTYDFPGDFTLNATCGNDAGQIDSTWAFRTVEKVIHVTAALPVADFSCTPRYGTVHFDVECTDLSTNDPTSWMWRVENGSVPKTSLVKHPIFNITWADMYNINLSVSNSGGSDWENKTGYIIANNTPPIVVWNKTPSTANISTWVYFVDSSTGTNITAWNWSFDDGNVSSSRNTTHKFLTTGVYTILHNVTDSDGTLWNVTNGTYETISIINNTPNNTFWSDVQSGYIPLTVTFTEAHNQTVENYTWLFVAADGTIEFTDRNQTPVYIFKNVGIYSVNYSVMNYENVVWFNRSGFITTNLPPAPVAAWNATIYDVQTNMSGYGLVNGTKDAKIQLVDSSSNTPTSWLWTLNTSGNVPFNSSTDQNWNVVIKVPGLYSVNFSATNIGGTIWLNRSDLILVQNINATIIWNISANGANPPILYGNTSTLFYTVDRSTGTNLTDPDSYYWNWTDGNATVGRNATHKFPVGEEEYRYWSVAHNTTEDVGTPWQNTSWYNLTNIVRVFHNATPNITFTADSTSGSTPITITFTATDVGHIKTDYWCWTFGDGGISSGEQNPVHTYTSDGIYDVHLIAGNYTLGITDTVRTGYITVTTPLLTVNFNATPRYGTVSQQVIFVDLSTGSEGLSWTWDIDGDGVDDSTKQNYTHTYADAGAYTINHSATNAGGVGWDNRSYYVIINNTPPIVVWNGTPTTVNLSTLVYFVDSSTGTNITAWNWSFGDGNVSSSQNATNRFPETGWYDVLHNVTDSNGTLWNVTNGTLQQDYIHIINNTPNNTFWSDVQSGNVPLTVTFTEAHNQTVENYTWLFVAADGTIEFTDRNQTPVYIFKNVGTYSVNYSVMNYENQVWFNRSGFITASAPTLTANFNATPRYGTATQEVVFVDLSTGGEGLSWTWDIDGDGVDDSIKQNYTHTYADAGAYTINHSVTNVDTSWDNRSYYVIINNTAPIVIWNGTPTTVNLSTVVYFVDSSTGTNITAWNWSFGDENVSSSRNTTHRFPETGWYDVLHNVTDSNGTLWNVTNGTMESAYIHVINNTLTAGAFTCVPVSGDRPVSVTCTDATTGGAVMNYTWIFDGNNQTSEKDPTFIYDVVGTFSVNHSACNDAGCVWYNRSDYITITQFVPGGPPPVAAFSCAPRYGTVHLDVECTDASSNSPTSWLWTVENGTSQITSAVSHPIFNITWADMYSVNLLATNGDGSDWENKSEYVIANNSEPVLNWAGVPLSTDTSTPVVFTDTSTGTNITWWNWSFGDGSYKWAQNPTHTYTTSGKFTVVHTVSDSNNTMWNRSVSETRVDYITISNSTITPLFTCTPTSGAKPLSVTCTDGSTGGPAWNWTWILDGNTTSHDQNPSHIYTDAGKWDVNFSPCNENGCWWLNKSNYITVTSVTAAGGEVNVTINVTPPNVTPQAAQYRPLNDWRVWLLFVIGSFAFLVTSHISPRGNDLFAVLALICAITATWGSVGLAMYTDPIPYISNQTTTIATYNGTEYNGSITITGSNIYYSAVFIGSPWLTLFFGVFSIITLLNILYVYVEIVIPGSIRRNRNTAPPQQIATQELPDMEVENGYYDEWGNHRL